MVKLTEREKRILQILIEGIPLSERPFYEIAKKTGFTEKEVLEIIKNLMDKKNNKKIGYNTKTQSCRD